jgi:hypothetical protein
MSRLLAWLLSILAVPLLYLLTFPVVLRIIFSMGLGPPATSVYAGAPPPLPHWVEVYEAPYLWLYRSSPRVGQVLERYGNWVMRHLPPS